VRQFEPFNQMRFVKSQQANADATTVPHLACGHLSSLEFDMNNLLKVIPWSRLVRVGKPFWQSDVRTKGFTHLFVVLALLGGNALVAIGINHTAGNFMTSIEMRSMPDFMMFLILYLALLVATALIQVFYAYFRTRLALIWRKWLSNYLFSIYFSDRIFLAVNHRDDIDFAEQRMSQDVDSFCNSFVGLFIALLDAAVNVIAFMVVLWVISPTLSITVTLYSSIGLLIVFKIGKTLVNLCNSQLKNEADLRDSLAHARKEADSIHRDGKTEEVREQARTKLSTVIETLLEVALVHRNIQMFTNIFNLLVPIIPAVLIAPAYFRQEIPFGTITQAVLAFTAVFNGATIFIGQFAGITNFAAVTNRLGSLIETMESCRREHESTLVTTEQNEGRRPQEEATGDMRTLSKHGTAATAGTINGGTLRIRLALERRRKHKH